MNFGYILNRKLEEKGITMTELSKRTGITYNMIKKYCRGNADPTLSYARLIASELNESLDTMADYKPKEEKAMFRQVFEEDFTYIRGFMRNVRRYGNKTAVIDPLLEKQWTYAELNREVNRLANALADREIVKGDVVLFQLLNSMEFLSCYLAPQKLGVISSPANYDFSPAESAACMDISKPRVYVYDSQYQQAAVRALEIAKHTPDYILMAGEGTLPEGHIRFSDFIKGYPEREPVAESVPSVYDEVLRLYTSGTTGKPKGVPVFHINEVLSAHDVLIHFPMNMTDITMNTTPWFHRGGIHSGGPTPTLYTGGTVVIMRHFQHVPALKYIEKYRITFVIGVPSTIKMLVRQQEKYNADLSSLKGIVTMGAPFSRADCMKVQQVLTTQLFNGYGTTETFWNTFLRPYDLPEMSGTAGRACVDDDVRVVKYVEGEKADPNRLAAMDESEIGEVIIRSPKASYCYYKDAEEEMDKFTGGWMYTGDLAVWDKNQFITITGRKDDMIISGGENIYPPLIEEALNQCPKVARTAVTGVPDVLRGEAVAAYIVPKDDSLTVSDLVDYCNSSDLLSGYKRPRYYRFVKELPVTAEGKLRHYMIREMALNDLEQGMLKLAIKGH